MVVMKFGGSVLSSPADAPAVASDIYAEVRRGHRVIAVVLGGSSGASRDDNVQMLLTTGFDILRRRDQRPEVMISGSAIGWYGDKGDTVLEENAIPHDEFMHRLCQDWEHAAQGVTPLGIRLCILRTGVVLGRSGGMLKRLLPVFGLGLGGRLGSGEQWISWVALGDYLNIIRFLLNDTRQSGIFNATAPKPVSNSEFTAVLAQALGRPAFLHLPASVLKLAMGEMSALLLHSQRVVPSRLLEARFKFRSGSLEDALRNELG